MAFARVQGTRIVILHSRRNGAAVRQEKLHEFSEFTAAWETVESDRNWNLLCKSLALTLGSQRLDRDRRAVSHDMRDFLGRKPATLCGKTVY